MIFLASFLIQSLVAATLIGLSFVVVHSSGFALLIIVCLLLKPLLFDISQPRKR